MMRGIFLFRLEFVLSPERHDYRVEPSCASPYRKAMHTKGRLNFAMRIRPAYRTGDSDARGNDQ